MAAPRAREVLEANVKQRPVRYDDYHTDLVALLIDALAAAREGHSSTQRRRDLAGAVKAKASVIGSKE